MNKLENDIQTSISDLVYEQISVAKGSKTLLQRSIFKGFIKLYQTTRVILSK